MAEAISVQISLKTEIFKIKPLPKNKFSSMVNLLAIYVILSLCTLNVFVYCSYPITIDDDRIPLPPSMSDVSTVVYNDMIYTYGGQKYNLWGGSDKMFSYRLDHSTGNMSIKLENEGQGPTCAYCSIALFPDSQEILVLAEPYYNASSQFYVNGSSWEANQTVLPHFYHLEKKTWRIGNITKMNGDEHTFFGRVKQTTVTDGSNGVYILGGIYRYFNTTIKQVAPLNNTINPPLLTSPEIPQNGSVSQNASISSFSTLNPNITAVYGDTSNSAETQLTVPIITDGWYYNRHDESYTAITLPGNKPYVDSFGYIDLDGKLALAGGCNDDIEANAEFYNKTIINLYNGTTLTWTTKNMTYYPQWESDPETIAGAATEIDYKRKLLYVFGGYFMWKNSSYESEMLSILDLENNTWITGFAEENSEIQMSLSYASLALIGDNYLVKMFGLSTSKSVESELSSVDVLNLTFSTMFDEAAYINGTTKIKWVHSILENNIVSSESMLMKYIGLICVSAVIVIGIVLFLILRRKTLPSLWYRTRKSLLWDRRKGEPIWTELSRLIYRVISLLVITGFLFYNVHDVLTSTISSSSFTENADFVTIPDFRVCLSGWNPPSKAPACTFPGNNLNVSCEMKLLNNFYYAPHYDSQMTTDGYMTCYMYAPDQPMNVSKYNASVLITTGGETHDNDEAIFFQLYRREDNINRLIFFNESMPGISKSDVQEWSLDDTKGALQIVTYPKSYTKVQYQETKYSKIKDDQKWNYLGVYPEFNKETKLSMEYSPTVIPNSIGNGEVRQYFFNSITLTPKDFTSTTITEKRDSTILDIFGSIGGVIGLIVGLQVFLFGNRPSKPWGIVHYWTWRQKNISDNLEKQFYLPEAQIPFVNPVDQKFEAIFRENIDKELGLTPSDSHSNMPLRNQVEDRLSRLEARNQLLEMVLRNYYIDDEVFISLSRSRNRSGNDTHTVVGSESDYQEDYDNDEKQNYDAVPLTNNFNINEPYPRSYQMPYPRK